MFNFGNVDEALKNQKAREEKQKKLKEDLTLACKEIFKDNNGFLFLQYLKDMCLWDEIDNNINNEILIYKKGRRDIWLLLREYLPTDILIKVEQNPKQL